MAELMSRNGIDAKRTIGGTRGAPIREGKVQHHPFGPRVEISAYRFCVRTFIPDANVNTTIIVSALPPPDEANRRIPFPCFFDSASGNPSIVGIPIHWIFPTNLDGERIPFRHPYYCAE